jgi:hypothetical protein
MRNTSKMITLIVALAGFTATSGSAKAQQGRWVRAKQQGARNAKDKAAHDAHEILRIKLARGWASPQEVAQENRRVAEESDLKARQAESARRHQLYGPLGAPKSLGGFVNGGGGNGGLYVYRRVLEAPSSTGAQIRAETAERRAHPDRPVLSDGERNAPFLPRNP